MKDTMSRASVGSWVKDLHRGRSLGFVLQIDHETGMMLVTYPKIGISQWSWHKNVGQYRVINK